MNIYQLAILNATPEETAKLVEDMASESERYRVAMDSEDTVIKELLEEYEETIADGPENVPYSRYEELSDKARRVLSNVEVTRGSDRDATKR